MPDRWEVERAIKTSSLPAPSRHIMLTLLTHISNGTLVIPSEFAPSLSALAAETGISRASVAEHLNRLEREGWLTRSRPPVAKARAEKARTAYALGVPVSALTGPGAGLVTEEAQVGASPAPGLVQELDQSTSPGAGLVNEEPQLRTSPGAGLVQELDTVFKDSSSPTEKKAQGGVGGDRSQRKPETPIAENFALLPSMLAWAKNHKTRKITVDLDAQTEEFINWAQANDIRSRDWPARWRNWILRAQSWADERGTRASPGSRKYAPGSGPIPPPRDATNSDDPEDW